MHLLQARWSLILVRQHVAMGLQVNPAKAPQVVGGLLDAEAPDEFVNNLILSVRSLIPVEALCAEVRLCNPSAGDPSSD